MTIPQFSPIAIEFLIVEPLRYFFKTATADYKLVWDEDPKIRSVEIGASNDFHKIALQDKPRILVDRGSYQVGKTGLSNSLMRQKTFGETGGLLDKENILFVQGTASIMIEARQKGACETLTELATRFMTWSSPLICSAAGFKDFALPMIVSPCQVVNPEQETEMFSTTVSIPYMKEDVWRVYTDGIKFKTFIVELVANGILMPDQ